MFALAGHSAAERQPLLDAEVAGTDRGERARKLVGFDFGEEAEVADVDAEDRQPGGSGQRERPQDGPVAAGRDHQVGGRRELVVGHVLDRRPTAVTFPSSVTIFMSCCVAQSRMPANTAAAVAFGVRDHADGREVRHVERSSCDRSRFARPAAAS